MCHLIKNKLDLQFNIMSTLFVCEFENYRLPYTNPKMSRSCLRFKVNGLKATRISFTNCTFILT